MLRDGGKQKKKGVDGGGCGDKSRELMPGTGTGCGGFDVVGGDAMFGLPRPPSSTTGSIYVGGVCGSN